MADTKNPGDKPLSVGTKTLSLKPRTETGVVRQSFSHGRTKQVVVEKKTKRRLAGDPAPATEAPPPPAAPVAAAAPAAKVAPRPTESPRPAARKSGVVLQTLTEDEQSARASALADARVREEEERRVVGRLYRIGRREAAATDRLDHRIAQRSGERCCTQPAGCGTGCRAC